VFIAGNDDVLAAYADNDDLVHDTGVKLETPCREGIEHFVRWWKEELS